MDNSIPAFPRTEASVAWKNREFNLDGMSLRDYFAGRVLSGALSMSLETMQALKKTAQENNLPETNLVASICYEYADAMILEREKANDH